MKVLLYELNEVPWRVVDDYIKSRPRSNWARLASGAASFTSLAPDTGELSPWVTWPTMHRGVPNDEHGIAFLGQDPETFKFDPIWKILHDEGRSIGIFGSLQSWPVPALGPNDFYVPDTFARDASCHPPELSAFQRFNLDNVKENGRVVRSRPGLRQSSAAAFRLWRLGLRTSTLVSAGGQLAAEIYDRRYAFRRAVYQGKIAFDLYEKTWLRLQPDFSTFFTNHVAGLQHRYWQAKYPADYSGDDVVLDPFFRGAIDYGMSVADAQLGRLMRVARRTGALLMVASSMGQEAVHKGKPETPAELQLRDVNRLADLVGLAGSFTRNLAMEPQVALEFRKASDLDAFNRAVGEFTDGKGNSLFRTTHTGLSMSVTIKSLPDVIERRTVNWRSRQVPLDELGFEVIQPDSPGTAYHMPEGILLAWGPGVQADSARHEVSTLDFAPTVLELFGRPVPAYMKGRSFSRRLFSTNSSPSVPGSLGAQTPLTSGRPDSPARISAAAVRR